MLIVFASRSEIAGFKSGNCSIRVVKIGACPIQLKKEKMKNMRITQNNIPSKGCCFRLSYYDCYIMNMFSIEFDLLQALLTSVMQNSIQFSVSHQASLEPLFTRIPLLISGSRLKIPHTKRYNHTSVKKELFLIQNIFAVLQHWKHTYMQ